MQKKHRNKTKLISIHFTPFFFFFFIKILSSNQMDILFSPSHSCDIISSNYSKTSTTYLFQGSDSSSSSSSSDHVHSPVSISSTHTEITSPFSSDEEDVIILASDCPKKRAGRTKFKETRHPVYRGVRKRNNEKWVCELREPNKKTRIWLGTYSTPEMAARAHDVAAIALRGKAACLNFADSVWRLPVPVSLNAKDIRKAAAEAAKLFTGQKQQKHLEVEVVISASIKKLEKLLIAPEEVVFYMDEEEEFEMPRLLAHMAEGMLLSTPPCYAMGRGINWDHIEYSTDEESLWN